MPKSPVTLLLACSLLLLAAPACSDDEEDPILSRCNKQCAIDKTHHCFTYTQTDPVTLKSLPAKEYCLQKCQQTAGDAEKRYQAGCGLCIAGGIGYSVKSDTVCQSGTPDVSCCWGVISSYLPDDSNCSATCLEADGGPAS